MEETGDQGSMACRGIRGATTVESNTREAILDAAREMLAEIIRRNGFETDDVASAYFSTTPDLNAEFPAVVARSDFGWHHAALMCGHEMYVPGSLQMCLRVMVMVNTEKTQKEIQHVFLRGAAALRPDLATT